MDNLIFSLFQIDIILFLDRFNLKEQLTNMTNSIINSIKKNGIRDFIRKLSKAFYAEKKEGFSLSVIKKMKCYREGFRTSSYFIYQFDKNDSKKYISDMTAKELRSANNIDTRELLNNKVEFENAAKQFVNVPKNIGIINMGKYESFDLDLTSLEQHLKKGNKFVLKPIDGKKGRGIVFLSQTKNGFLYNELLLSIQELRVKISELNNYLVTELVSQADYADRIFPGSTNTIRLLVMTDPNNNFNNFISAAVHRFGSDETVPVDNWSKGGLSANIDIKTGIMFEAVKHPKNTEGILSFVKKHPNTNEVISGVKIPNWENIKKTSLDLADKLKVDYVGWDILVTNESFYFIEGNCNSDLDLLQVHSPLLTDNRVVNFIEYYTKKKQ